MHRQPGVVEALEILHFGNEMNGSAKASVPLDADSVNNAFYRTIIRCRGQPR